MSEFGSPGKSSDSDIRVDDEDRLEAFDGCELCTAVPGTFLFTRGSGDEVQLEDCEGERFEVTEEARVEADDGAGLPLSSEFNGGNFGQLKDRCPLHFFKPGARTG